MLQLFDKNKNKIAGLIEYKDLCIESVLENGDKTLSFLYSKNSKYYFDIEEEGYIRNKQNEFVIKEKDIQDNYTTFICKLNIEELEGKTFDRYESIEQTITAALNLAIVGTGWTVAENNIKKKRTVRKTNCSSWDIIKEIKSIYRVDITFNTLEKKIEIYEHLGQDKGTYFIEDLNLKSLQVQSNSYSYVTRVIPVGKDGLTIESINNNKNYVENYQYSNKVKTIYWNDDRYTIKESLLEDAKAKLNELSKPYRAYTASIINLSKLNPKYNILDYKLGDDITLISKRNKLKEKQRIIKTIEYPQDHNKDTIELANATLKFEDIQTQFQDAADTVDNITLDDGTLDGEAFEDGGISSNKIDNFKANVIEAAEIHVIKGNIQNLNAAILKAGQAILTKADITQLNSVKAEIQTALIGKANVNELNVAVERVGILEGKTLSVENQLAGNLTAKNFKANSITAGSGIIAEGAIGSAQISSLSVNKLEAGEFITSKHKIVSADGTIEIVGNQILVNRNNLNRVILGEYRKQDNTSDYGLLIRAKD
ncbi:phage tail protein, partial [Clostridium sp. Ade.TY]|uniref:phage tail protein n=1 Tax=Clostridium sp. Ade.TY TaxID=1391647 RepID=UPI00046546DB